MTFATALAGQLARPHGATGRLLGRAMDFANREPTRHALDLLLPRAGEHILDVGCGTGAAIDAVLARVPARVTGIDPSGVMVAMATKRLGDRATVLRASMETMAFAPATFDAALLLNVLYFCDPQGAPLARVRDVLKPGGRVVAYVTHRDTMRGWSFARAGLHRLYDEAALMELFMAAGFVTDEIFVRSQPITGSVMGLLAIATR